ncbi:hypothetical protein [Bacteroides sp. 224]|uniref:hypothetical protein n=1 Tax=Bacteroides sp. 224 TaxID=2302936 RepID=UPI0013D5086F|nr:hypothetical protein [Bacteroides sp. 224]NDV63724.1 hypothetical protein [Bacteroides sp. 224]
MKDITESYKVLNQSFRKVLIYHVGIDAGFFAEYSYMVSAILYCLQHKIQFKLYSADANFGYDKGWNDYFIPFCEEVNEAFHHTYNTHAIPSWKEIIRRSFKQKNCALLKWKFKHVYRTFIGTILAIVTYKEKVRLNHHIKFNPNQHFYISELGIDGDYMHAFSKITEIVWRFNQNTAIKCRKLIEDLQLPLHYAGCQIRGGDKITETELIPSDYYIRIIKEKSEERTVFVLTDDYRIFQHLQKSWPEINWFTLCAANEQGYVNSEFTKTNSQKKEMQMMRFLSSMQILIDASFFVGSITTGPSLFLLRIHPHAYPVDCSVEDISKIIAAPIAIRSKLSTQYMNHCGQ